MTNPFVIAAQAASNATPETKETAKEFLKFALSESMPQPVRAIVPTVADPWSNFEQQNLSAQRDNQNVLSNLLNREMPLEKNANLAYDKLTAKSRQKNEPVSLVENWPEDIQPDFDDDNIVRINSLSDSYSDTARRKNAGDEEWLRVLQRADPDEFEKLVADWYEGVSMHESQAASYGLWDGYSYEKTHVNGIAYNPDGYVTPESDYHYGTIVPIYTNSEETRSANAYNLVIDQFDVVNNPRYATGGGLTYCNKFVQDVCDAMGVEIPKTNANTISRWLAGSGASSGWREVTAEEAQRNADMGHVVVSTWINLEKNEDGKEKPGHVQIIRPTKNGDSVSGGPYTAQAGSSNWEYEVWTKSFGPGKQSSVKFYMHK